MVRLVAAADIDSNHTVEKNEFRSLITHMASADLWSRQLAETVWPAVNPLTASRMRTISLCSTRSVLSSLKLHATAQASKSSSSESESEPESEEEVAQNEILQSILLESYEEVVIKQKQSGSDG